MIEESPLITYCVGYALPITCCLAGVGLSCFGCYRYYHAACLRYHRQQEMLNQAEARFDGREQKIVKRDTLKKKMVDAFIKATKKASSSKPKDKITLKDIKDTCPICIQEYEKNTSQVFIGLIKGCGHYFHFECIWEWLEHKRDCPICRETCQLSEADLKGLSLEQALEISCAKVAVPSTFKPVIESHSNTSTLTSTGSVGPFVTVVTTAEVYHVDGEENGAFEDDVIPERRGSNDDSVVVSQPRSVRTMSLMFEQRAS